jgi:hypothetical protein
MGKVVDDITSVHMDEEKWVYLIDRILETVLFTK